MNLRSSESSKRHKLIKNFENARQLQVQEMLRKHDLNAKELPLRIKRKISEFKNGVALNFQLHIWSWKKESQLMALIIKLGIPHDSSTDLLFAIQQHICEHYRFYLSDTDVAICKERRVAIANMHKFSREIGMTVSLNYQSNCRQIPFDVAQSAELWAHGRLKDWARRRYQRTQLRKQQVLDTRRAIVNKPALDAYVNKRHDWTGVWSDPFSQLPLVCCGHILQFVGSQESKHAGEASRSLGLTAVFTPIKKSKLRETEAVTCPCKNLVPVDCVNVKCRRCCSGIGCWKHRKNFC